MTSFTIKRLIVQLQVIELSNSYGDAGGRASPVVAFVILVSTSNIPLSIPFCLFLLYDSQ
jgi:hypothetical protein